MDVANIDREYQQLQDQSQQTAAAIKSLATKLQGPAQGGNQDAREWLLDLREIALAVQAEQNQVGSLLQSIHGFIANQAQQHMQPPVASSAAGPSPWGAPAPMTPSYPPPGYPPQQAQGSPQQQGGIGGMLGGFLNSGFGRAIEMGAGFGIGDDLINKIF